MNAIKLKWMALSIKQKALWTTNLITTAVILGLVFFVLFPLLFLAMAFASGVMAGLVAAHNAVRRYFEVKFRNRRNNP
jgi:hypothetical protein